MSGYLADLAFWTFFCWLAVSSSIGVVVIAAIVVLDCITRGCD